MNTAAAPHGHRNGPASRFLLATLPVALTAGLGSLATVPNIPTWYAGLAKPPLTPPNGAFGPVWSVLYVLMAYAVWRILAAPAEVPGRGRAIGWFFVQLALNALWPWSFFAARSPAAGAVNIVALVAALAMTIFAFRQADRVAAWLLAPYLGWVLYAAYLNLGVLVLNR